MPIGGQASDTGITIRAIAIDQASGRLRAIAAEVRMLPSQFSQVGAALKGFALKVALPAISARALASAAISEMGDRASDALTRASDAIKSGWQSMIGDVVLWIESCFGPLPDIAANIANHIIIAFKDVRYSWAEENALP